MSIDGCAQLRCSPDVLVQHVGEECVLLDLASEKYYALNEVGARAWQSFVLGRSVQKTIDTLLTEYDVTEEDLNRDVRALVRSLLDAGLATIPDDLTHESVNGIDDGL